MDPNNFLSVITTLITGFLAKEAAIIMFNTIAVAGLTYGFLDIFMQKPNKTNTIKYPTKTDSLVSACWMVVLAGTIPWGIAIIQAMQPFFGSPVSRLTGSITSILTSIVIGYVLCWLFSLNLKRHIIINSHDTEDEKRQKQELKKEHILFTYALYQIGSMLQRRISIWISTALTVIGGIILEIMHFQFIKNYAVWAIIINLLLSLVLISIMGSSSAAGSANMIGSLIGGVAHAIMRSSRIRELRTQYVQQGLIKEAK